MGAAARTMRAFIAYFSPLASSGSQQRKKNRSHPRNGRKRRCGWCSLAWSVGARRIGLAFGLSFPSGTPGVAGGGAVARSAGDCLTDPLTATERAGRSCPVAGPAPCDVTPRRRSLSDEHGGAAHGLGWGWPSGGHKRAEKLRAWARLRVCGSGGPQARATPIAAPSRERSDGVGGGPRRQEPQRVAVGDKQQRGMDAAPPC